MRCAVGRVRDGLVLLSGGCAAGSGGLLFGDAAVGFAGEYPTDGGAADAVEVGEFCLADLFFGVSAAEGTNLAFGEPGEFLVCASVCRGETGRFVCCVFWRGGRG